MKPYEHGSLVSEVQPDVLHPDFRVQRGFATRADPAAPRAGVQADQATIAKATAMQAQGWEYVMPMPKSAQAAWGNKDGRTTWFNGYWINRQAQAYFSTEPKLQDGKYFGDGINPVGWRRGGSPARPSVLEWLLPKSGGVPL
jgi:hypothetical protein